MSNPRTPRQEESWLLAGRRWPDWQNPGERSEPTTHTPEPANPNGARRPSWCGLESLHRTHEQILEDDRELAERKAAKIGRAAR